MNVHVHGIIHIAQVACGGINIAGPTLLPAVPAVRSILSQFSIFTSIFHSIAPLIYRHPYFVQPSDR